MLQPPRPTRRDFTKAALALTAAPYAHAAKGLPPLKITEVRAIPTSAGHNYQWVFLKILTSEPGLYGIGSASNLFHAAAVVSAIQNQYAPFWIGKDPDRIEDLWQSTNVRTYWRNSTIQNNILSALDMALWDIKGKRAGMPVYDLIGGKVRDAVPTYAHADGRDREQVVENVKKYMDEGYRHVRAQMGGYGGGGMIPPGQGSRPHAKILAERGHLFRLRDTACLGDAIPDEIDEALRDERHILTRTGKQFTHGQGRGADLFDAPEPVDLFRG